jgi:hypothetical protein
MDGWKSTVTQGVHREINENENELTPPDEASASVSRARSRIRELLFGHRET